MLVVSPWSTGGWVCSETFDHTSLIRFIEQRHGVSEPNITPWRRTVAGDLTSAFDFGRAASPTFSSLPSTEAYKPTDDDRHPDYVPTPPTDPKLPSQERGTRPARALGYRLEVTPTVSADGLSLLIANQGRLGAALQARPAGLAGVPSTYTVGRREAAHRRADGSRPVRREPARPGRVLPSLCRQHPAPARSR